jgi:hypothetical protein
VHPSLADPHEGRPRAARRGLDRRASRLEPRFVARVIGCPAVECVLRLRSAILTESDGSTLLFPEIVWQKDADVAECQRCAKSFGLFVRKVSLASTSHALWAWALTIFSTSLTSQHHCRRCAKIYCGSCSSARSVLPPGQIVLSPDTPLSALAGETETKHRVCATCMDDAELVAWLAERAASTGEAAAAA